MSDAVNHPSHYTQGSIEVWDFIVDQRLPYLLGNVVKYVSRAGRKGGLEKRLEDLNKAMAYLNKAIVEDGGEDVYDAPKVQINYVEDMDRPEDGFFIIVPSETGLSYDTIKDRVLRVVEEN